MDEFRNEFMNKEHREPTFDEMNRIQDLVSAIIGALIGSSIAGMVLEGLLYMWVYYFIWSFIVRSKGGGTLTTTRLKCFMSLY